jgi:hypothetical protein
MGVVVGKWYSLLIADRLGLVKLANQDRTQLAGKPWRR